MQQPPVSTAATWLLACTTLVVALVGCGGDEPGAGTDVAPPESTAVTEPATGGGERDEPVEVADGPVQVRIAGFTFDPEVVTVATGSTVVWTNEDDAVHSISDRARGAESADMAQDDVYELTYDEPGQHPYVCGIHEYMRGTVIVGAPSPG